MMTALSPAHVRGLGAIAELVGRERILDHWQVGPRALVVQVAVDGGETRQFPTGVWYAAVDGHALSTTPTASTMDTALLAAVCALSDASRMQPAVARLLEKRA